jgi:predicted dehydrogenase
LRTALAGFGRLPELHYVPALARLRDCAITCVAEPLPSRRQAAQNAFPTARIYTDLPALLGAETIDALLVAAPPSGHREAIQAAIDRRIPLFLEKPFLPPGELRHFGRMEIPATPMMINFNRRFWGPYRALRKRLRSSQERRPVRLQLVIHVNPRQWKAVTEHRMQLEEGGLLQDLGSQALDLATFLMDQEPVRVRTRFCHGSGHDARASLKVGFPDGSSALCSIAYGLHPIERITAETKTDSFTIFHPMAGLRANAPNFFSPTGLSSDFLALAHHTLSRRFSMVGATVHSALQHFFSCVRAGTKPQPDWSVAVQNARALEAVWLSHREKRGVDLSEIPVL